MPIMGGAQQCPHSCMGLGSAPRILSATDRAAARSTALTASAHCLAASAAGCDRVGPTALTISSMQVSESRRAWQQVRRNKHTVEMHHC